MVSFNAVNKKVGALCILLVAIFALPNASGSLLSNLRQDEKILHALLSVLIDWINWIIIFVKNVSIEKEKFVSCEYVVCRVIQSLARDHNSTFYYYNMSFAVCNSL